MKSRLLSIIKEEAQRIFILARAPHCFECGKTLLTEQEIEQGSCNGICAEIAADMQGFSH